MEPKDPPMTSYIVYNNLQIAKNIQPITITQDDEVRLYYPHCSLS